MGSLCHTGTSQKTRESTVRLRRDRREPRFALTHSLAHILKLTVKSIIYKALRFDSRDVNEH